MGGLRDLWDFVAACFVDLGAVRGEGLHIPD